MMWSDVVVMISLLVSLAVSRSRFWLPVPSSVCLGFLFASFEGLPFLVFSLLLVHLHDLLVMCQFRLSEAFGYCKVFRRHREWRCLQLLHRWVWRWVYAVNFSSLNEVLLIHVLFHCCYVCSDIWRCDCPRYLHCVW